MSNIENSIPNAYIDRVYGYAIRNTFTREEADELSQEILCTTLRQLDTLRDEGRFEPWLWGLAANVTRVFRRKQGRRRAMYSFDTLADTAHYDDYAGLDEAIYEQVRAKIAGLSKTYRDIIVLRYYDNLSCRQISEKLGIPEGTVTWRLSEGRSKLKKEYETMTETALRPVALDITINGGGNYGNDRPFPSEYINDALSQNILFHCYKEPKTVEELSKLCGVPAYYIEDAAAGLLRREAVTAPAKGKYLTDFIIYDDTHNVYNEKAPELTAPFIGEYASLLKDFTAKAVRTGVNTAGKPESELVYLFGLLALMKLNDSCNPLAQVPYKVRYDGNEWTYSARIANSYKLGGIKINVNRNTDGVCSHHVFAFAGFTFRQMMNDAQIGVCDRLFSGIALDEKDKETASELIENGYLSKDGGDIRVGIPVFTVSQKAEFDALAAEQFRGVMPAYTEAVKRYTDGYRKLFPKHLREDVDRAMHQLFVSFFVFVVLAAREKGLLERPQENRICDVLIRHR